MIIFSSPCSSAGCDRRYIAFTDDPVGWLRTSTMPANFARPCCRWACCAHHALHHAGGAAAGLHPHARAKGLPHRLVVMSMRCPTALIPITTVVASSWPADIRLGGDGDAVLHSGHGSC